MLPEPLTRNSRAALVTDIELIDDYPSHFSAYSRRKHRWVRGDWQIMRWIGSRVPAFGGRIVGTSHSSRNGRSWITCEVDAVWEISYGSHESRPGRRSAECRGGFPCEQFAVPPRGPAGFPHSETIPIVLGESPV
jgi:hypothetical protein